CPSSQVCRIWIAVQRAKCDGVAQRLKWRNAVLPLLAHLARQQIDGARCKREGAPLPALILRAAEPETGRRQQRDADHVLELRPVAMPADRRAGLVFADQDHADVVRLMPGPAGGAVAQGKQRDGKVWHDFHLAAALVVARTERQHAAQALIAA